jgi:hypothetical protein
VVVEMNHEDVELPNRVNAEEFYWRCDICKPNDGEVYWQQERRRGQLTGGDDEVEWQRQQRSIGGDDEVEWQR